MRSYIFPSLVMITALALAAGAALFTIIGFRELFQPTWNITIMAATIELAKIVAVSVLYQFKHILGWFSRVFLTVLVLGAMAVTSMGVYGYLSSSYQRDTLDITKNESTLQLLNQRKASLEARLADMDSQIAKVPEAYVSKRMELIAAFKPERQEVISEIEELESKKLELTMTRIEKETEFGAIILLAKSIEWLDEDKSMLYFILLVIFIFDPMAIALTHAANVGFANVSRPRELPLVKTNDTMDIGNILNEAIAPLSQSISKVSSELDELKNSKPSNTRADIIDSMRKA